MEYLWLSGCYSFALCLIQWLYVVEGDYRKALPALVDLYTSARVYLDNMVLDFGLQFHFGCFNVKVLHPAPLTIQKWSN